MKKSLNEVLTGLVNSAQDPLEKHNLLFSKKKKKSEMQTLNADSVSKRVLSVISTQKYIVLDGMVLI